MNSNTLAMITCPAVISTVFTPEAEWGHQRVCVALYVQCMMSCQSCWPVLTAELVDKFPSTQRGQRRLHREHRQAAVWLTETNGDTEDTEASHVKRKQGVTVQGGH